MAELKFTLSVVRDGATAWIGHIEMAPLDVEFVTRDAGDEESALKELARQLAPDIERFGREMRILAGELSQ